MDAIIAEQKRHQNQQILFPKIDKQGKPEFTLDFKSRNLEIDENYGTPTSNINQR